MYYVSDFTNKIQKHSTITTFSFEKVVVFWKGGRCTMMLAHITKMVSDGKWQYLGLAPLWKTFWFSEHSGYRSISKWDSEYIAFIIFINNADKSPELLHFYFLVLIIELVTYMRSSCIYFHHCDYRDLLLGRSKDGCLIEYLNRWVNK